MSDSDQLLEQARQFDDSTLEHLANRGLVRRARKLLSPTPTLGTDDRGIVVEGDSWSVGFEAGESLASGRCDCATAGICQHVLAAIMHLRDQSRKSTDDSSASDVVQAQQSNPDEQSNRRVAEPASDPVATGAPSIRSWLGSLSDADLLAYSKQADGRWAASRASGLDPAEIVVDESSNLAIELPIPHGSVRFLGPSLDRAIVKPTTKHDRRVITLAVLALWLTEGREIAAEDSASIAPTALVPERLDVCVRSQRTCADLLSVGLLHVGDPDIEHLDSIAASARGVKLYRLAILAERASDQIRALTQQEPTAETATLLDQLAEINVVAETIERRIDAGSAVPDGLVGRARADFQPIAHLSAIGVGHYHWGESRFSGSSGVMIDSNGTAFTISKPNVVAGRKLSDAIGWQGGGTIAGLSGRRISLSGAKASDERRLSTSDSISADLGPPFGEDDLAGIAWNGGVPSAGSRLLGRPSAPWVVIGIEAEVSPMRFDGITQRLEWTIACMGAEIDVVLPYRSANRNAVDTLERLGAHGPVPRYLVGHLRRSGPRLELWPIAAWAESFINLASAPTSGVKMTDEEPHQTPPPDHIEQLGTSLLATAERGTSPRLEADLAALARRTSDWGLHALAVVLKTQRPEQRLQTTILRSRWTMMTLRDLQT